MPKATTQDFTPNIMMLITCGDVPQTVIAGLDHVKDPKNRMKEGLQEPYICFQG